MALDKQNPNDTQGVNRTADVGPIPIDPSSNYSIVLGYTGSNLTTVTKTKDGISYRKTLTYTGSVVTAVSTWVVV